MDQWCLAHCTGVVLVGSCPGGVASNVMAFITEADLALSITLTTVGHHVSPLMTASAISSAIGDAGCWAWMKNRDELSIFEVVTQNSGMASGLAKGVGKDCYHRLSTHHFRALNEYHRIDTG